MPLRTRVWSVGKLLLLVGALGATFLLFAVIAMRIAVRAREVPVPDLVGRQTSEATALLAEFDLTLRVEQAARPDPTVPAGRILVQEPPAGENSRRLRSVRVWVSAGPRIARMPELVGRSERSAQMRLSQDGLPAAIVAEIRSADYAPDVVVAQDPAPGTTGADVFLLVNRGEERPGFVMPDLVGLNGERVAVHMRSRGFRVSIVAQQPAPGIPSGIVLRKGPAGGYQIEPGHSITLEVSR
jgi:serine/threonine-protein kinase